MKRRITYIRPLKVAATFAIIQGGIALIMFLPMIILSSIVPTQPQPPQASFPKFIFILMPIFATVMSFIMGAVMAALYNFTTKFTGGIEFSVEDVV